MSYLPFIIPIALFIIIEKPQWIDFRVIEAAIWIFCLCWLFGFAVLFADAVNFYLTPGSWPRPVYAHH